MQSQPSLNLKWEFETRTRLNVLQKGLEFPKLEQNGLSKNMKTLLFHLKAWMSGQKSRHKVFQSLKSKNIFKCWLPKPLFCAAAETYSYCRVLVVLWSICSLPEMFQQGVWVCEKLLMKPVTISHDMWTMLRSSGYRSQAEDEKFWKT